MDDDQLIEQLLVRIVCIFEDTSAVLLLKDDTPLADRVATARVWMPPVLQGDFLTSCSAALLSLVCQASCVA